MSFLPYGRQTIEEDDIAAVVEALRGDYLTTGPKVAEFEAAFCREIEATHAVACNSGTAALHLALLAFGLKEGEQAVVPSVTFLATANAVRYCGAEVVFADVDPDTGLMTPQTFEAALKRGQNIEVALPVHLNGQVCDMATLAGFGVPLVEDACHALGAEGVGRCGHSVAAAFSTHPVKAIATGEGGVITTQDAGMAEKMRQLRTHGMVRDGFADPWYYEMPEMGWNYRMPDILCALGISQIKKLRRFMARRLEVAALYDRLLAPLSSVLKPVPHGGVHGWHLYAVLIDFEQVGLTRREVMERLKERGVGSQVHYFPVHRQPYYVQRYGDLSLPGADRYYARCLSLPFYPLMRDEDVERVVDALLYSLSVS